MNKFSKIFIIITFLVVFSNIVYAQNETNVTEKPFEVKVESVKNMIDFEENARFKITITNPRSTIETFSIKPSAPYVEWFIKTDPTSDYSVKVYPNSKKEVFLVVKPLSVGMGRYALRINVKHELSKEIFNKDIIVNIVSMSHLPSVSISGRVPSKIDPRESFVVTAWLENRNAKELKDIRVELVSDTIRESTKTSLSPFGTLNDTKTIEFSIKLDKKTAPIKDSLRIVIAVKEDDEVYELKSAPYDYEIISYGKLIDKHNPKFKWYSILGKYDEITFVNDANTKFEGVAKLENPFYRALFTKATPKPDTFIQGGKRYIGWVVNLKSQETFDVIIRVNYIPLFVFLIIIILGIIFYFKYRSPLIITKSIKDLITKEGGITNFKVVLHIKSRSKDNIKNIAIIDRIPDIADFEKDTEMGTLNPVKIVHTKRGIIGKWIIPNLDKDEETVIKYKVKSRLSILGKVPLPITIGKFSKGDKIIRSYSNRIRIGS
jgi:hypothetical protein